MSDPIAKLLVTLGMDSAEFSRGAKRAIGDVHTMQTKISAASTVIKGAIGAMITSAAVDRVIDLTAKGLEYASSLGETAAQLGVTTKALQEYRYIASQVGIEQDQMEKGLAKLSIRIGQAADGNKQAVALFKSLGVSIRDVEGNVRDTGDVLPDVADAFNKLGSEAERTAMSAELFGAKMGPKFNTLLAEGSKGINNLRKAAHDLGIVLDDGLIQNADDAADKMAAMKMVLEAKIAGTVAANAREIANLADKLAKLADSAIKAANAMAKFISQSGPGRGEAMAENNRIIRENRGDRLTGSTILGDVYSVGDRGTTRSTGFIDGWGNPYTKARRIRLPKGGRGGGRATGSDRVNAVGLTGFDLSGFEPGGAAADWIKAKTAIDGVAASAEKAARRSLPELTAATGKLTDEMKALRDQAQGILDRLFPDQAARNSFLSDMKVLDMAMKRGAISADVHADAVAKLRAEFMAPFINRGAGGFMSAMEQVYGDRREREEAAKGIRAGITGFQKSVKDLANDAEEAKRRWDESWMSMAESALSSMDRLVYGIKSGNWFDTIMGVLSLIDSVAGLATGGKGTKIGPFSFGNSQSRGLPGFATGGSMMLGGMSGIDTNLLSLNGRPIARTTAGETMTISPSNDNRRDRVDVFVHPSGEFDARVEKGAARVVAGAAPHIANAGASQALSTLRARQNRALG